MNRSNAEIVGSHLAGDEKSPEPLHVFQVPETPEIEPEFIAFRKKFATHLPEGTIRTNQEAPVAPHAKSRGTPAANLGFRADIMRCALNAQVKEPDKGKRFMTQAEMSKHKAIARERSNRSDDSF